MDVTFLAINYAPSVGGAQTLVRRVAEGLVERHGHHVRVVTTDALYAPGGSRPGHVPVGHERIDGVDVQRLPVARRTQGLLRSARRVGQQFGRPVVPSVPSYGPWGARLARAAMVAGRDADVVVGVSAPFTTIPAAMMATRRGRASFVAAPILHLGAWAPSRALVRVLAAADRCIALTASERDWLVAQRLDPSRVQVVPPGCDDVAVQDRDAARAHLRLAAGPVVAVIGRLAAQKGIDTVLAACPEMFATHPGLTVLLAGSRTGWSGLDDALAAMPPELVDRIVVLDGFGESDRPNVCAAADVVLVPSREEAFGMVILEAWAAGRPVVASALPAIRSTVRDGMDGVLVPVGDPAALASAVADLLGDLARAEAMGAAGQARVESEFRWGTVVDGWNQVLVDAAQAKGAVA